MYLTIIIIIYFYNLGTAFKITEIKTEHKCKTLKGRKIVNDKYMTAQLLRAAAKTVILNQGREMSEISKYNHFIIVLILASYV